MRQDETEVGTSFRDARLSRRRVLQLSAGAGAAAFLAACGTSGTATPTPTAASSAASTRRGRLTGGVVGGVRRGVASAAASGSAAPTSIGGNFKMATWIGYIDVDASGVDHPSLDRFTQETGIQIDYQEAVNDNEEFFASQLQGPLQAGVPTGWDIVVLTDWMIIKLINLKLARVHRAGPELPGQPRRHLPARAIGIRRTSTPRRGSPA